MIAHDWIETPLGPLLAVARDGALAELNFVSRDEEATLARLSSLEARHDAAALDEVRRQIDEYFAGKRTRFELRLAPEGSAYQKKVWARLAGIPYGATASYGQLARQLASSARAVGRANATNPIAIVVPCHRVIGNDGKLTGYAGGLERKAALLNLERATAAHGLARAA
jgi:methylated-DNA-[protein]-cysteine S-methyltransferase